MLTLEDVLEKCSFSGALKLISCHSHYIYLQYSVFDTYQETRQEGDRQSLKFLL